MASPNHNNQEKLNPKSRNLSDTEYSWCRAVSSGTGNTVLALEMADRSPSDIASLRKILHDLQISHPILRSKLHFDPTRKEYSFHIPSRPHVQIDFHDSSSTSQLIQTLKTHQKCGISDFHLIFEHELNNNRWVDPYSFPCNGIELLFSSVYMLSETKSVVVMKLHAAVCDRTTGVSFLRAMMEESREDGGVEKGIKTDGGEVYLGIDSLIPNGVGRKTIWAHGKTMLGYSFNTLRLTNLEFINTKKPRFSEVVRLRVSSEVTARIIDGCKSRRIKLCGALAAAGLIAAHSIKFQYDHEIKKKYGVVTLIDCRPSLEPALSTHHFGFYQSAILDVQTIRGNENFWDLAQRIYSNFADHKKRSKHLADLSDINYLMCKAMENPSLTSSSSLRTSFISVFEDPVFDGSIKLQQELGVECYMGCASAHGVGPSVAIFDTIRDGELDCACVYPSPLHSRGQMNELVDRMRKVLMEESD
ncbi:hypothetical protein F511_09562 [Dorcoceras hygrometricum]|uniref:Uncharacterized protein n=1 Tax=Dorcoceras hygrometricum TaxID=472368 RepID=A0A2Z7CW91_9LAMI|nr:hypothetical protein F511_09560 [Dorcoceras hygrometricum]KZV48966.1 hypothetical protein F511_09562 [Dorcoceras hygrometricum]